MIKLLLNLKKLKKISLGNILIYLIKVYQKKAPERLRSSCRFEPTCSNYTIMAIKKYGALKGSILGAKRIMRCHYPNGGKDYP